jgi:hypothetical protein
VVEGVMGTKWQDRGKPDVLRVIAGSVALWLFWRIPLVVLAIYFFSTMPSFDTPLTANNIMTLALGFGAIMLFYRSFGSDHRRPVLKPPKLKKKFIEALLRSEPIVPKHEAPKDLVGAMVFDDDRQFFDDFRDFGEVVNLWLADEYSHSRRWRLQELSDTELRHHYSDMLSYGRRFSIFHNQVCVGDLEISAGPRYSPETPNVHLDIKLRWVRVLGFENVFGFLREIAGYTQADFRESRWAIDHAVLGVLCETQEIWDDDDFEPGYAILSFVCQASVAATTISGKHSSRRKLLNETRSSSSHSAAGLVRHVDDKERPSQSALRRWPRHDLRHVDSPPALRHSDFVASCECGFYPEFSSVSKVSQNRASTSSKLVSLGRYKAPIPQYMRLASTPHAGAR